MGDQITSEGSYAQYVENFFISRYPDRAVFFSNAGCANDTAADVLERMQADVLDRGVNYAFVMLGTWDGSFRPFSQVRFQAFQGNYRELINRLTSAKVHPFIISPPMFDEGAGEHRLGDESYRFRDRRPSVDYNEVMAQYATWLREESGRLGHRYIDVWEPLNTLTSGERRINPWFSLIPDSLQPDEGGHAIIAATIAESLALERDRLGKIALEYTTGEGASWRLQTCEGGVLTQLVGDVDRVSFLWKPKSLPWAFPDSAMLAVQLARIEERFNSETIQLTGLQTGDYELVIAGERMPGFYPHTDLAKGLELHRIADRPNQLQSHRLAEANQRRYSEVVLPLRELWQTLKRTRQGFPGDDARYLQAISELKPQMESLREESNARLQALYRDARPQACTFEFKRVLEPVVSTEKPAANHRHHRR